MVSKMIRKTEEKTKKQLSKKSRTQSAAVSPTYDPGGGRTETVDFYQAGWNAGLRAAGKSAAGLPAGMGIGSSARTGQSRSGGVLSSAGLSRPDTIVAAAPSSASGWKPVRELHVLPDFGKTEEPQSYEKAADRAQRVYEEYRQKQEHFEEKYGSKEDKKTYWGYAERHQELQQLEQEAKKLVDYMNRHYQEMEAEPLFSHQGTAADVTSYEQQIQSMQTVMEDYVKNSNGLPDPAVLQSMQKDIVRVQAAIGMLPKEPEEEEILLQVLGGNYYDGVSLGGTVAQMGLGLTGLDAALDLRDLSYDLTHLRTTPWHQTALDVLALLPLVGVLKYGDEAAELAQAARRADDLAEGADALSDTARAGQRMAEAGEAALDNLELLEDVVDSGGRLGYNQGNRFVDMELMPTELMDELANSGLKYTQEDVLMVTRNSNGDLMWLEKGNSSVGFTHVFERHGEEFLTRGYSREELPGLLREAVNGRRVSIEFNSRGYISTYEYGQEYYRVAYGTNGFVVTFFPFKH